MTAGLAAFCGAIRVLSCPCQGRNSRLIKVVIVVMVFVVVVMLMPLHHLCQPPLIKQHAGQVPHLLLLYHWSCSCQGAQGTIALVLLGSLLVLAVGGCGLVRGGLAW